MAKKRGLGRGLDALIGNASAPEGGKESLRVLPIHWLQPGRYQPRTHMDDESLDELASSIRVQGVIQPIIVRAIGKNEYEIIAGERRWRASQRAELTEVPCVIRDTGDRDALAMALIENIQREDLNALEEAQALARLIEEFDLTHSETAEAVGRSRASVSNLLRLLELPEPLRRLVDAGKLDMGHARALLSLPETQSIPLGNQAADKRWTVREVERRVKALLEGKPAPKTSGKDNDVQALEQSLGEQLGARVSIKSKSNGGGKLTIEYHSLDELDGIIARIKRK